MVVLKDDFLPSEGFLYFFFSLNEDINEEDYIVFRETEEIQFSAKTNIRKLVQSTCFNACENIWCCRVTSLSGNNIPASNEILQKKEITAILVI